MLKMEILSHFTIPFTSHDKEKLPLISIYLCMLKIFSPKLIYFCIIDDQHVLTFHTTENRPLFSATLVLLTILLYSISCVPAKFKCWNVAHILHT